MKKRCRGERQKKNGVSTAMSGPKRKTVNRLERVRDWSSKILDREEGEKRIEDGWSGGSAWGWFLERGGGDGGEERRETHANPSPHSTVFRRILSASSSSKW